MWSLGCIVHEMCQLKPPFSARNECDLARIVIEEDFTEIDSSYSSHLRGFVKLLLEKDVITSVFPPLLNLSM